jgi:hypothetical protein
MITMIDFIEKMFEEIPDDMNGDKQSPAQEHLFKVNKDDAIKLEEKESMIVHCNTAKLLFLSQRARPDVQTATSFLCTQATKYLPCIYLEQMIQGIYIGIRMEHMQCIVT